MKWLIDSGCSNHMSGDRSLFKSLEVTPQHNICLGDDNLLQVEGVGTVILHANSRKNHILTNVLFVPKLAHILLSVGQLMNTGYKVEFSDGECIVIETKSNNRVARIPMTNHRLFPLEANDVYTAHISQKEADGSTLWHRRYGHLNQRSLHYLIEHQLVDGLPIIDRIQPCEACALGK